MTRHRKPFKNSSADWHRILSMERSLGFKSQQGLLLCHRQNEPVLKDLFTRIAGLFSEFTGLDVDEIWTSSSFQAHCDPIFDGLGPLIWEGPAVSWLTKTSDCYWKFISKDKRKDWRSYFYQLVSLYLAHAQLTAKNTVSIRCPDGSAVDLGKGRRSALAPNAHAAVSNDQGEPSPQATDGRPKRRVTRPKRYGDDHDIRQSPGPKKELMKAMQKKRKVSSKHCLKKAQERLSEQRTVEESITLASPQPPRITAARESVTSPARREIEQGFSNNTDGLYRLKSPAQRKSLRSVTSEMTTLPSPVLGISIASSSDRPNTTNAAPPGDGALPGLEVNEPAEQQPVTANCGLNDGLDDSDEDDDEPPLTEPPIKEEPGGTKENPWEIPDDDDDNVQRSKRQRISNAGARRPPLPSPHRQSSNARIFDGRRARVSWGPKAPFDDIIDLSGCSDSDELIQRVEAIKVKCHQIRRDRIIAAGLKFDGGACFRILWTGAGPAFEEMKEMVQGVARGQKFDLRFEIEWEDEGEDPAVKMEDVYGTT